MPNSIRRLVVNEVEMRLGHWLRLVLCVHFSVLTLEAGSALAG